METVGFSVFVKSTVLYNFCELKKKIKTGTKYDISMPNSNSLKTNQLKYFCKRLALKSPYFYF